MEVFEQIYSFRTFIYYGKKTMELLKKKLWFCGKNTMVLWKKNYDTLPKTMELWFTLIYYGKDYGTMEKTLIL